MNLVGIENDEMYVARAFAASSRDTNVSVSDG